MQIHQFFLLLPLCVHLSLCTVIKSSSSSPSSSPSTTSFSPRSRVLGLPTCTDAQTSLILRVLQQVSQWSAWAARTTRNRRWDGEKEPDGSPYLPPDYPYDVFTTSFGHVDVRKSQSARFFVERRFAAVQGEVRKSGTGTGVKSLGLVRIECDDVGVECQDPFVPFYGSSEENFIVLCPLFFTRAYPFQPEAAPTQTSKPAVLLLALLGMKFAGRRGLSRLDVNDKDPLLNPDAYVDFASRVFFERQRLLNLPYADPVTGLMPNTPAGKVRLESLPEEEEGESSEEREEEQRAEAEDEDEDEDFKQFLRAGGVS